MNPPFRGAKGNSSSYHTQAQVNKDGVITWSGLSGILGLKKFGRSTPFHLGSGVKFPPSWPHVTDYNKEDHREMNFAY